MKHNILLKQKAIEIYLSGKKMKEVAEQLNIHECTVQRWMSKEKISRHRGPLSLIGKEDYFDDIDTEEKAYWLGFIMADGCVSIYNGQYCLKLHISSKDRMIIDDFLIAIDSKNSPYFNKNKDGIESYAVSLSSRHMVESLMSLGVVPNKTGYESLPEMSGELTRHFIRGFFDGDGITDISQRRSGFVSSKRMLEQIQKEVGTSQTMFFNNGAYYYLVGLSVSRWLYHYMYSDCTVYLKRKRDRMWSIL